MADAQVRQEITVKLRKKIVFDGHIYDLSDDSEDSSKPDIPTRPETESALAEYSDGTYFPANF